MLSEKRITEAELNLRNYLNSEMIKKTKPNQQIIDIFTNNSKESIQVAQFLIDNNKSDLWVIVSSYYSMFYMANAVLNSLGYKVGDKIPHKITADALIIYVRTKLTNSLIEEYEEAQSEALPNIKADTIIDEFDKERIKRNTFQYETTDFEKHSKAITSLKRAKEFNFELTKLLLDLKN
jgi:uncharacterized protein (UPF0332 family)